MYIYHVWYTMSTVFGVSRTNRE